MATAQHRSTLSRFSRFQVSADTESHPKPSAANANAGTAPKTANMSVNGTTTASIRYKAPFTSGDQDALEIRGSRAYARPLRLAYALNQVLEARKLSQADAAKVLGVTQPKVSALRHYKLAGFSVERLMNLLTAVDQDVEIVIRRKPRSRKAGRISVVAA